MANSYSGYLVKAKGMGGYEPLTLEYWGPNETKSDFALVDFPPKRETTYHLPVVLTGELDKKTVAKLGLVVGSWVTLDSWGRVVEVNGQSISWKERTFGRSQIPRAWIHTPSMRTRLLPIGGDPVVDLLQTIFPIPYGSAVIIEGPFGSRKSQLMGRIMRSVVAANIPTTLLRLERPDERELQEKDPLAPRFPVLPQGIREWAMSTRNQSHQPDVMFFASLCYLSVAEEARHGRHSVLGVDSLQALEESMSRATPHEGRTLSGGVNPSAMDRLMAECIAISGAMADRSLTIFVIYRTQEGDKGNQLVSQTLKGRAHVHLRLYDKAIAGDDPFTIDLDDSLDRSIELITFYPDDPDEAMNKEETRLIWAMRRDLAAEERAIYQKLMMAEYRDNGGRNPPKFREDAIAEEAKKATHAKLQLLLKSSSSHDPSWMRRNWRSIIDGKSVAPQEPAQLEAPTVPSSTVAETEPASAIKLTPLESVAVNPEPLPQETVVALANEWQADAAETLAREEVVIPAWMRPKTTTESAPVAELSGS